MRLVVLTILVIAISARVNSQEIDVLAGDIYQAYLQQKMSPVLSIDTPNLNLGKAYQIQKQYVVQVVDIPYQYPSEKRRRNMSTSSCSDALPFCYLATGGCIHKASQHLKL